VEALAPVLHRCLQDLQGRLIYRCQVSWPLGASVRLLAACCSRGGLAPHQTTLTLFAPGAPPHPTPHHTTPPHPTPQHPILTARNTPTPQAWIKDSVAAYQPTAADLDFPGRLERLAAQQQQQDQQQRQQGKQTKASAGLEGGEAAAGQDALLQPGEGEDASAQRAGSAGSIEIAEAGGEADAQAAEPVGGWGGAGGGGGQGVGGGGGQGVGGEARKRRRENMRRRVHWR